MTAWDIIRQHVLHGLRLLARNRGFAATEILALARTRWFEGRRETGPLAPRPYLPFGDLHSKEMLPKALFVLSNRLVNFI